MRSEIKSILFALGIAVGICLIYIGSSVALTGTSEIRYAPQIVGFGLVMFGLLLISVSIITTHDTGSRKVEK